MKLSKDRRDKNVISKAIVTYKDVTDMSRMFFHNAKVTSVDLSGFDSYEVTSMGGMFSDCNWYGCVKFYVNGFQKVKDKLVLKGMIK